MGYQRRQARRAAPRLGTDRRPPPDKAAHFFPPECGSGEDHFALVPAGWLERAARSACAVGVSQSRPSPEAIDVPSQRDSAAPAAGRSLAPLVSLRRRGMASDFRCQANALNSMAFQRVLRGRQQCVLWKYGHGISFNAEFLMSKKRGGAG